MPPSTGSEPYRPISYQQPPPVPNLRHTKHTKHAVKVNGLENFYHLECFHLLTNAFLRHSQDGLSPVPLSPETCGDGTPGTAIPLHPHQLRTTTAIWQSNIGFGDELTRER